MSEAIELLDETPNEFYQQHQSKQTAAKQAANPAVASATQHYSNQRPQEQG